ncbi:MAG: hypothetical protein OQL17_04350 [Sedimenticola sp.]|nr:hypothetical protein [Sedimenticola sp.]MCW8949192.1 hypothetical protein [Sedimenticola sp.]MCW8975103.1 hypothetical protein [Sedimenticola sp.]
MRAALFFVAFGFLFAFVIPQMVSTFFIAEDPIAWQLMQGADPTTLLEKTASGIPSATLGCEKDGYQFYTTQDGIHFLRHADSPYIAALIEKRPTLFKIRDGEQEADSVQDVPSGVTDIAQQEAILLECQKNSVSPILSSLVIHHK